MTQESVALHEVHHVADEELIARLRRLVRADQTLTARLLVHIGEVDARGLYREHAYASMFAYCVEELHMSEAQAYLRIQAARLGREFPLVLQLLAQGALHLTAIKLLGPHLTADNHVQVLERASGKGKRAIELLVAEIAPKPDVPSRMRKLPDPSSARAETLFAPTSVGASQTPLTLEAAASSARVDTQHVQVTLPEARNPNLSQASALPQPAPSLDANDSRIDRSRDPNPTPFALEAPRPRASSKPLSPGRYKLELTAGQTLHDKLQQLQDLLRHQVPDGDLAVIVERAVDLLIAKTMQQRFAQTGAPKKKRPVKRRTRSRNANSRYIPRAVVRAVHQRDAGQCTFMSSDGKRCSERGFLELHHHDVPYARGGRATAENLRLVCRAHNALFAERDYGAQFMRSKRPLTRAPFDELGRETSG